MDQRTDDDLVRLFACGDDGAFDMLFDRHHAAVYAVARSILGRADGADEILQETFLAVARSARDYTPRGRFRAWLMRIVRNRCLTRIEADRSRRQLAAGIDVHVAAAAGAEASPDRQAESGEQTERIIAAVNALPPSQRQAIALYALDGMLYRDIAEVMDVPVNTVKTLIHRARANLAAALDGENQEP